MRSSTYWTGYLEWGMFLYIVARQRDDRYYLQFITRLYLTNTRDKSQRGLLCYLAFAFLHRLEVLG